MWLLRAFDGWECQAALDNQPEDDDLVVGCRQHGTECWGLSSLMLQ
jgi:hypothetical protein